MFKIRYIFLLLLLCAGIECHAFQLGYFYPERKAEILEKGNSILELKERHRPGFVEVSGYSKMPLDRLLAEYHLHNAGKYIDKVVYDSAIYHAEEAVRLSEGSSDEELKLVALVTAGKIERLRLNLKEAAIYFEQAKGLHAPLHQEIYRLWNLYNLLSTSQDKHDGFKIEKCLEMLTMVEGMETEALRLWYVYITQRLAALHRSRNELDKAKTWFERAATAAKELPADNYYIRVRLGMVHSGFLFKVKDYNGVLEVLTDLDKIVELSSLPRDKGIYMRRWYRLNSEGPPEFLRANQERILYDREEAETFFRDESSPIRIEERIKGLNDIIESHTTRENWKKVAELYAELRVLEGQKKVQELKDGFNQRNALLQASADAQEALRVEQLERAKANQRLFVFAIVLVLAIGIFIYRNSIQRKRQNLVLSEKNQLIQSQKQDLEQINELKTKFFTNISHELRTPLTLVLGTIRNALNGKYGPLNNRQSKSLAIASANSNRILSLVKDMLDLSKIESGKEKIKARQVDLENEVHTVLNLFDMQIEEKGLDVEVKVAGAVEPLYLDPLKLETILFNLVSNAVRHSDDQSVLSIGIGEEGERQKLSVSNQGAGIPEAELPYVFDRFYQAGSAKSGEGSGVGLSLTKELVHLHQAEISVTSSPGGSTRFTVSFLKGKSHLAAHELSEDTDLVHDEVQIDKGLKVLVVEDNADMRHYLYELLSEKFRVSLAENGKDALNRIAGIQPDLVITDYMMPEMNGVKFFRAMRKLEGFADVPVVFLTARAIERDKEALLREGVDDYILKPFDDAELFRSIGQLLSLKVERRKHSSTTVAPADEMENKFLNLLRATVFASMHETSLSPAALAEVLSVSERTLYRKVKAATGFSPQAYIKEIRLQEARRLLEKNSYESISEVAYAVGFEHLSHFSSSYKERFGKLASEKETLIAETQ